MRGPAWPATAGLVWQLVHLAGRHPPRVDLPADQADGL